jgi:hypothetical protein
MLYGRIILKLKLKELMGGGGEMWTEFIWLKVRGVLESCEGINKFLYSIKCWEVL